MKSDKYSLNQTDFKNVLKGALVMLIPLVILYLGNVATTLQVQGHILTVSDFVPNAYVLGGVILYIMNRLTDLGRKWAN